jgi:hypothetical protein
MFDTNSYNTNCTIHFGRTYLQCNLGYIATYLFISCVEIDGITTILVSLFNPKSFLNSIILSIIDVEHGSDVVLEPLGLPFACANDPRPVS